MTLKPGVESDKVDVLWDYPGRAKAVQVTSTKNEHGKTDIQGWATRRFPIVPAAR